MRTYLYYGNCYGQMDEILDHIKKITGDGATAEYGAITTDADWKKLDIAIPFWRQMHYWYWDENRIHYEMNKNKHYDFKNKSEWAVNLVKLQPNEFSEIRKNRYK